MKKYCIYKLKDGKELNEIQEMFSEDNYVYVEGFARNPLDRDVMYAVYKYIDIETLEYTSQIMGMDIIPCAIFEEYFELYWDTPQINEKIMELANEDEETY